MRKIPHKLKILLFGSLLLLSIGFIAFTRNPGQPDEPMLTYTVDPNTQDLQLYWKNEQGEILKSIKQLKSFVESKKQTLLFAMNAGMYNRNYAPQGLFIQNQKILAPLDTAEGDDNFHLKPNGVFFMTNDRKAFVCTSSDFKDNGKVRFATQSGPMLLIDGQIHPAFRQGSTNLNIRNGVGILPDGQVVFAMSKTEINFYDFASYFLSLGCKNALYLDGFVSRTYLPKKNWIQTDGQFGVMIGVTEKRK